MRKLRWGTLLLLLAAVVVGRAEAGDAPAPASHVPEGFPADPLLYVCVQDEARVAVVDMESRRIVDVVDLVELGFSDRSMPHDIAVEPDGSHWYVSLIGQDRVLRFDRDNRLVGELEMETPGMLDFHPTEDLLVISRSMSAVSPPSRVGVARASAMELEEVDVLFSRPHGIVMGPHGRFAYTASLGANQIASVELGTHRVEVVDVEGPPHAFVQFAVSPNGEFLVASGELSGELVVFELSAPDRPAFVTSLRVGQIAFDPYFTPDGREIWVPIKGENRLAIVSVEDWEVVDEVNGDALLQPHAIRFSDDGSHAFVTTNNRSPHAMHHPAEEGGDPGALVIVETETRRVVEVIELGRNVTGLGHRSLR